MNPSHAFHLHAKLWVLRHYDQSSVTNYSEVTYSINIHMTYPPVNHRTRKVLFLKRYCLFLTCFSSSTVVALLVEEHLLGPELDRLIGIKRDHSLSDLSSERCHQEFLCCRTLEGTHRVLLYTTQGICSCLAVLMMKNLDESESVLSIPDAVTNIEEAIIENGKNCQWNHWKPGQRYRGFSRNMKTTEVYYTPCELVYSY